MRPTLFQLCIAILFSWLSATGSHAQAQGATSDLAIPLFFIAKSDSRNEVHYSLIMRQDCRIAQEPVRAVWRRRADPATPPRPLAWFEKALVYGVHIVQAEENRVTFTLAADDTRPVVVEMSSAAGGCAARARVRVLGEWMVPQSAFIEIIDGRPLVPEVSHVELRALRDDGSIVCERVTALRSSGVPC